MSVGTKSVLFGVHCFCIHPFYVAMGWWRLYGFPWDPRLWAAFFLHDIGYIGCPNMDGEEGSAHPQLGAWVMWLLFGDRWGKFCLYHSRFYAKEDGHLPSRLCAADKMSVAFECRWFYLLRARASGELHEYMHLYREALVGRGKYANDRPKELVEGTVHEWYNKMVAHCVRWAKENRWQTWEESSTF